MTAKILVVDDEKDMLALLKRSLEPELDCTVDTADSGETAMAMVAIDSYDLVMADIKMPSMGGMELLKRINEGFPEVTVIMMTAYGRIDLAVEAMKEGAYDFITKPFDHDALVLRVAKALERSRLLKENLKLHRECTGGMGFQEFVGKSSAMQKVYETIKTVAKTDFTVLITGESGTGKELAARAVHALSNRRNHPFVAINCPTVPENILESELFGYKKGAFTHATTDKHGLFQEAHRGSLFLDEIGDISPSIQTKLLRVIQEKEIKPLGSPKSFKVDVRIIASTNQDLEAKISSREFREDLYYRLNVVSIRIPPLRERKEDIPLIANHFLRKHCERMKIPAKRFSIEIMEKFMAYSWPGNVRELENLVIQGILYSRDQEILPRDVALPDSMQQGGVAADPLANINPLLELPYRKAKEFFLQQFHKTYVERILEQTGGNVSSAARKCGIERQALQQVMRRYGIDASKYRK